jgi:2-methylcitrate dehydratase PrpD
MDHASLTRRDALMAGGVLGASLAMPAAAQHGGAATKTRAQHGGAATQAPQHGGGAAAEEPALPVMPAITRYIAGAATAAVPEPVREMARLHILDTLASVIACRDLEASRLGRAYATAQSGGAGATPILGSRDKATLVDAVFASAMTAHAAEINDFIPSALVQPGPSVVSAALLLGSQRRKSGRDMVNAVVAGYELAGRIPKTLGSGNLQKAGLANHGVAPVFGTAVAAASLIGFDAAKAADLLR